MVILEDGGLFHMICLAVFTDQGVLFILSEKKNPTLLVGKPVTPRVPHALHLMDLAWFPSALVAWEPAGSGIIFTHRSCSPAFEGRVLDEAPRSGRGTGGPVSGGIRAPCLVLEAKGPTWGLSEDMGKERPPFLQGKGRGRRGEENSPPTAKQNITQGSVPVTHPCD